MSDQRFTESVAHGSSMSITEPGSSHTLIQDDQSLDWQRQHQPQQQYQPPQQYPPPQQYQPQQQYPPPQQYQSPQQYPPQQEYQTQLSRLSRQDSQQASLPQTQMQSLQYGTTGSIHELLDTGAYDLPMSEPKFGTPWDQAAALYDIGRYDGRAFYNTLGMASSNGEERGSTSLPDLSLSTPSALHCTPATQSDSGVVGCTTQTPERSSSAYHGRRQDVTSENGTRRSSPRLRGQEGETYHKAARRTKKKLWEKQYYKALIRMDELTKYHRVAQAMRMCGHPPRDPEEYKSMS